MKWPLLGIITVILLQTIFTAYNALHRPIESLVAVSEINPVTNPVAGSLDQDDAWDSGMLVQSHANFNKDDAANAPAKRRSRIRPSVAAGSLFVKSDRKSTAINRISAVQIGAIQKKHFEPVIITYPKSVRTSLEFEDYSVEAVRSSENRSFFSKTTSVIKKPFKWLKAFGTKLL